MEVFNLTSSNSRNSNEVAQSSAANNPLQKSDADIEKVVSKKCHRHPLKKADLLHLNPHVDNPRICISCVQQYGIQTKEYLQINDVLLGSSDSDLFSYPVFSDPQLRYRFQPNSETLDSDKDLIDQFYEKLLKQIHTKIETRRQSKQPKIVQLGDIYQRSMVCWSEILDIDKLKRILFEENNELKLFQFINTHIANSDSNTKKLREICDSFQVIQTSFSMEQLNQIKNLISSLLEQIDFFYDNNSSPPSLSIGQSGQSGNELEQKQKEVDQLQEQLCACRSQVQNQVLRNEELRVQNQIQSKQITELQRQLFKEKNRIFRLKLKLAREQISTDSSYNQRQLLGLVKMIIEKPKCISLVFREDILG